MNNPTKHFIVVMEYLGNKRRGIKDNSPLRKNRLCLFLANTLQHGMRIQIIQQTLGP